MTSLASLPVRSWRLPRPLGVLLLTAPLLAFLGVFFVLPVTGMLSEGIAPGGAWDLAGLVEVFGRPRVLRVLWFTLWSASLGTALSILLGLPAAHLLHRRRFRGREFLRAALVVPFVLPTVVVGVAFRQLLGAGGPLAFLGLDGSPVAIIAGLVFFNVAVVIRMVGTRWQELDPRPGEAAASLGAGPVQVWRTVTWPALRPAVLSAAVVVFLFCATAFGVVLTLGGLRYSSVETEIYLLTTNLLDLQAAAALSLLQLVVVTVLLVTAARWTGAPPRAGTARPPVRPGRSDVVGVVATGVLLLLLLAPLSALVLGSVRLDGAWTLAHYRALLNLGAGTGPDLAADAGAGTGLAPALPVPMTTALLTSLRTAVDATWLAVSAGLGLALVVTQPSRSRTERRIRGVLDAVFMLPLGVSAVTLGFGLLITLDEPPLDFRDSPFLVPLAQALVALPLVVRMLVPGLLGIDPRQRHAAASLGAGAWRSWATVELPVLWRPLVAAAGFAFAVSLGEFGATSFLVREDRPTVPVLIYRLIGHPGAASYGMALAASVVLAVTITVVVVLVERLRVPSVGAWR